MTRTSIPDVELNVVAAYGRGAKTSGIAETQALTEGGVRAILLHHGCLNDRAAAKQLVAAVRGTPPPAQQSTTPVRTQPKERAVANGPDTITVPVAKLPPAVLEVLLGLVDEGTANAVRASQQADRVLALTALAAFRVHAMARADELEDQARGLRKLANPEHLHHWSDAKSDEDTPTHTVRRWLDAHKEA